MNYNTMRFCTDSFTFDDTTSSSPKLFIRINGNDVEINLSDSPTAPAIAIRIGGQIYYAGLTTDLSASSIRISIGGNAYAIRS